MKKKYIHKITRKGKYSYAVILPKEIIEAYKWRIVRDYDTLTLFKKGFLHSLKNIYSVSLHKYFFVRSE